MFHYKILFLTAALLFSCKSQAPVVESIPDPLIQEKMEELIQNNDLPGMNFSWISPKGKLHAYSAGFSDKETQMPLSTKNTLFSGSIGKTYAAALLIQLVDEGKVGLKKKWLTYFPDLDWIKAIPNVEEFSLEHLLQHRTGLPRYIMKMEAWDSLATHPDKIWSYEDRMAFILGEEAVHEVGKGWAYSDTNYILIGMLIERITGKPYYESVKTKLLDPFGLTETHPGLRRDIPHMAQAYSALPPAFKIPNKVLSDGKYPFNPQVEWTGGGFASTTSDLAKWAKIYFEAQAFSSEALAQIIAINPDGKEVDAGDSYGMGAFIYDTKVGLAYGHSGFMPGFNSLVMYFPEKKIAAAIQINCDYASRKMGLNSYMEILMERVFASED
ncbi:MAG: serine hydrolase domain-containing protein [Bacteroidota bacterium]